DAAYSATLLVGATNVPDVVDVARLAPGTLVVDDSFPPCLSVPAAAARLRTRGDLLFTAGGFVRAPGRITRAIALPPPAARFGFVARLEENWRVIRQEMTALGEGEFMPWPERSIYGEEGWRTFGLYAFGQKQRRGCALCPATARLVRGIPGMTTAGFSRLA